LSAKPGAKVPPLVLPEQLTAPEYDNFLSAANWRCSYRYVMDNNVDPMHGIYLHRYSHSMTEGMDAAKMHVRRTPTGFVFEKFDSSSFMIAFIRAFENFRNKTEWKNLQRRALLKDFSWDTSAKKYAEMFRRAIEIHDQLNMGQK